MGEQFGGDLPPLNPIPDYGTITEDAVHEATEILNSFVQRNPHSVNKFSDLVPTLEPVRKAAMNMLLYYGTLTGSEVPFRDFSKTGGKTPDIEGDLVPMIEKHEHGQFKLVSVDLAGEAEGRTIEITTTGSSVMITGNKGRNDEYFLHLPVYEAIKIRQPKEPVITPLGWETIEGTKHKYEPSHSEAHNVTANNGFFRLTQRAIGDMLKLIPSR